MNILSVNTAGKRVSADYNGKGLIIKDRTAASETLLLSIENLLSENGASLSDVDVFACVTGPGSFTGIRIGVTTVKAFAYALNKRAVPVNYMQVLAYNNPCGNQVLTVSDAGNFLYYAALFDGDKNITGEPAVYTLATLKEFIEKIPRPFDTVFESGLEAVKDLSLEPGRAFIEKDDTEGLYKAALKCCLDFKSVKDPDLEPVYIRKPQAEADRERKI